jgi:hypothetical protein
MFYAYSFNPIADFNTFYAYYFKPNTDFNIENFVSAEGDQRSLH